MRYGRTVPARTNSLGSPSDANEGDLDTIPTGVDVHASCPRFDKQF